MSVYRLTFVIFALCNIALLARYMNVQNVPWGAVELFYGVLVMNVPILVSTTVTENISKTLRG